jgi:hypothetical protein
MTTRSLLVLCSLPLSLACRPAQETPAAAAPAIAAKPLAVKAPAPQDCGGEAPADMAAADRQVRTVDPVSGATVTAVGSKLAAVPVVKVADVLARPEEWAGKTIRLEGNVTAMCTHRRAWFALQSEDKSGAYVRVLTAPSFLVPEGSLGKKARTEGVLEVTEVSAETATHYAQEHQLAQPGAAAADAPQRTIVLKAAGAEFI